MRSRGPGDWFWETQHQRGLFNIKNARVCQRERETGASTADHSLERFSSGHGRDGSDGRSDDYRGGRDRAGLGRGAGQLEVFQRLGGAHRHRRAGAVLQIT